MTSVLCLVELDSELLHGVRGIAAEAGRVAAQLSMFEASEAHGSLLFCKLIYSCWLTGNWA